MEIEFSKYSTGTYLEIKKDGESVGSCMMILLNDIEDELCQSLFVQKPEPVWMLDIPEEYHSWVNTSLLERQGESGSTWHEGLHKIGWLKQKPTAEELQERINKMLKYADECSCSSVSGRAHAMLNDIANGTK